MHRALHLGDTGPRHGVFQVLQWKGQGEAERLGVGGRHVHELGERPQEGAGVILAPGRAQQVVEVRQGVPRDEGPERPALEVMEQGRRGLRVGLPVDCDVQDDVGVEEDHPYFSRSAS
jgi:hypothetical protein